MVQKITKIFFLLLLTLLASKIYCMEPAEISPEEYAMESLKRYESTFNQYKEMAPEEYALIRHHPEGTWFEKLPHELQDELLKHRASDYAAYQAERRENLKYDYEHLINQSLDQFQTISLPEEYIFKGLIETGLLKLDDDIYINREKLPLSEVLIRDTKYPHKMSVLKLFIKNRAIKSEDAWNKVAESLYHRMSYLNSLPWLKVGDESYESFIDLYQDLIKYAPAANKKFIIDKYNTLLEEIPELKDIVEIKKRHSMPTEVEAKSLQREMEELHRF